ncbi:hypothetical protein OA86_10740 [Kaistella jeonii]|uniref:Uncharacterized protein n=1 Tax=Kaistella jeonii TaxID=266749 RepID=A0A0C1D3Y4_9FLAO|nr:hypothetical protein OA86_10740 [Kaistella jeonii]
MLGDASASSAQVDDGCLSYLYVIGSAFFFIRLALEESETTQMMKKSAFLLKANPLKKSDMKCFFCTMYNVGCMILRVVEVEDEFFHDLEHEG